MNENKSRLKAFIKKSVLPKFKFGISSSIATFVDYVLFIALSSYVFTPVISNILSQFTGMVLNFTLQKKYVFILQRKLDAAFLLSIGFSLLGIAIGTAMIWLLVKIEFFSGQPFITKLIVTGMIFFYNFYTKRFAFEKRFLTSQQVNKGHMS